MVLVEVQEPPVHLFSRELVEDLRVVCLAVRAGEQEDGACTFKGDILVGVRLIVQVGELAMVLPQLPDGTVKNERLAQGRVHLRRE